MRRGGGRNPRGMFSQEGELLESRKVNGRQGGGADG